MATRTTEKARSAFRETLVREFYYEPIKNTGNAALSIGEVNRIADLILRQGTTYCRLQEDSCNVEMNDRQLARHEKKEQQVEARVTALAKKLGCVPDFQGDPRGHTIKLVVPSGKYGDWDRTEICVPTS